MRHGRILWGRYVLDVVSGDAGVQVRCANGHIEQASVLVGADGAHSAVRQNLYRSLKEKAFLPKSDMEELKFTQNAIIGLTNPLNPSQYQGVSEEFGECDIVIGKDSPYTVSLVSSFVTFILMRDTWFITTGL
jgi:2-polyprenyl-6-methoxyphenol hydroxylase-like FAD-dependent oxidoreductase